MKSLILFVLPLILNAQTDWTWRNPLPQGNTLVKVQATDSGFVAFSYNSTIVSPDGINWTLHKIPEDAWLTKCIWTGERLVGTGDSGLVYTSVTGKTWIPSPTGFEETTYGKVWNGSELFALGTRGQISVSPDGINWELRSLPDSMQLNYIKASASCIAAWGTHRDTLLVSADGLMWYKTTKKGGGAIVGIHDLNGKTFAVDDRANVFEVVNCTTWIDTANLGMNKDIKDVIVTDSTIVAVGHAVNARTEDGYNWSVNTPCSMIFDNYGFEAACWSGSYVYAVGYGSMLMRWNERGSGSGVCHSYSKPTLRDVAARGNHMVAVGDRGLIIAGDGTASNEIVRLGPAETIMDIIWTGNKALACGANGTILVSDDGLMWSEESTSTSETLNGIAWSGSFYAAAGNGGMIFTSAEGTDWTHRPQNISADFLKIIPAYGGILAMGLNGQQLVSVFSTDGQTWYDTTIAYATTNISGLVWNGSRAVATTQFSAAYVTENCSTWTAHNTDMHQHPSDLIWDGNQFILIFDWSLIGTSPDGETWTERNQRGKDLWSIVWADTQFVAVGEDMLTMTSPDGTEWATRYAGEAFEDDLTKVIWTGNLLLAIGGSDIYVSYDGKNWVDQNSPALHQLLDVVWTGNHVLVAGANGTILSSGIDPTIAIEKGNRPRAAVKPPVITLSPTLSGKILIVSDKALGPANWTVHDIRGRVLEQGHISSVNRSATLSLSSRPAGIYFFTLVLKNSTYRIKSAWLK